MQGGMAAMQGRLATAARGRMAMPSSMGRPGSGMAVQQDGSARPMTAVRAAGFTSAGNRSKYLGTSESKREREILYCICIINVGC